MMLCVISYWVLSGAKRRQIQQLRCCVLPAKLLKRRDVYTPHLSRYIVPASNGGDMTRSAFTRMWNSHVVSLVPFPLHPHMLRHTYATTLYRARVDLRTAQKLMGHSSIQVTADIYTHLEQEDSLHVADKLNEYLSGKSENSVKSSQKVVKLAI